VAAEVHAALVAVEHRRVNAVGEGCADEEWVAFQRGEHDVAQFDGEWRAFGELLVLLDVDALVAGGDAAVEPGGVGGVEALAEVGDLVGGEQGGDVDQHDRTSPLVPNTVIPAKAGIHVALMHFLNGFPLSRE